MSHFIENDSNIVDNDITKTTQVKQTNSREQQIFNRLIRIDVFPYCETKKKFIYDKESKATRGEFVIPYLPWQVCLSLLKEHCSSVEWDYFMTEDGSPLHPAGNGFFVRTWITIEGITRTQHRTVVDNRDKPSTTPTPTEIHNCIQRCFVKNAATGFGLGLALYTQEKTKSHIYFQNKFEEDIQSLPNKNTLMPISPDYEALLKEADEITDSYRTNPLDIKHPHTQKPTSFPTYTPIAIKNTISDEELERRKYIFINALKSSSNLSTLKKQSELVKVFIDQFKISKESNFYKELKDAYTQQFQKLDRLTTL